MNVDKVAAELRDLSDRLRSVGAAANVTAAALLSSDADEPEVNAAEMLQLHVCEPLGVEIERIARMAKAYHGKSSVKPEPSSKPKKQAKKKVAQR